ncbi:MAG TPA: hypothetical protein VNM14_04740, partial [Planctomycetota bacterium]|nr:hypothetical protein [Planctomycetota bacterium]
MLGAALLFDVLTNRIHLAPKQIFVAVGVGLIGLGAAQTATMRELVLGPLKALTGRGTRQPNGEAA